MTEQTLTLKKPTNAQEAAVYLRARYPPDIEITDYMIREALNLDEDAPDPEGLIEALEFVNRQIMPQYPSNNEADYDMNDFSIDTEAKPALTSSKPDLHINKIVTEKVNQPTVQFAQVKPKSGNTATQLKQTNAPTTPLIDKTHSDNQTILKENKKQPQTPFSADKLQEIIKWASEQQGETANITAEPYDFFWTPEMKNFKADILNKQGKIYIVEGFSGAGKSSFAQALQDDLSFDDKTAVYIKLDGALKVCDLIDAIADQLPEKIIEKMVMQILPKNKNDRVGDSYGSPETLKAYIKKVGSNRAEKLLAPYRYEIMKHIDFLLIDFQDYDKNAIRQMNKDIEQVQSLWNGLNKNNTEGHTNIMLFLQREMCETNNHFFLKKAVTFILRPLMPQEIATFYVEKFDGYYPFTKEAFEAITMQCGGTWRRFKKILEQCLNNYHRKGDLNAEITLVNVADWIDPALFAEDRRLQFAEIFPKSERHQRKAAQVITYLESHQGEALQSDLSQMFFDGNGKECSQILTKLKSSDYVIDGEWRERRKVIKLKSFTP